MFHLGIEISAHVELFSYTMLAGYLVFVTPELRERRVSWNVQQPAGKRLSALFARLDFFARFQHEQAIEQAALCSSCATAKALPIAVSPPGASLPARRHCSFRCGYPLRLLTWRRSVASVRRRPAPGAQLGAQRPHNPHPAPLTRRVNACRLARTSS